MEARRPVRGYNVAGGKIVPTLPLERTGKEIRSWGPRPCRHRKKQKVSGKILGSFPVERWRIEVSAHTLWKEVSAILPFEDLLAESARLHGHLCPGQVIGVRMAMLGCNLVGVDEPETSKKLIVWVEVDRCATDAIQAVTGCKLGKRTLKFVDYGKMAATFLNTADDRAVRVLARDDARDRVWAYVPPGASKKEAQLEAYKAMPEDELFVITPVGIELAEEDQPGHPVSRVICDQCGEGVNDRREVRQTGRTLCRACDGGAYYHLPAAAPTSPKRDTPPVVAIVGYSDNGKTRVTVALIKLLTSQGYRVGAIKHCHHGHDVDRPGSDTDRFYKSGASTVIASSPGQKTRMEKSEGDASLDSLVVSFDPDVDIVVAEGFKGSEAPKVLVVGGGVTPEVKNVIATIGPEGQTSKRPDSGVLHYTFEGVDELAAQIQRELVQAERRPA